MSSFFSVKHAETKASRIASLESRFKTTKSKSQSKETNNNKSGDIVDVDEDERGIKVTNNNDDDRADRKLKKKTKTNYNNNNNNNNSNNNNNNRNDQECSWCYESIKKFSFFRSEEKKKKKNIKLTAATVDEDNDDDDVIDIVRELLGKNPRDIGHVEDVLRTKLPKTKTLMLENVDKRVAFLDKEVDAHRKMERRQRFQNLERVQMSNRARKKRASAMSNQTAITWETMKRVRKLWKEYAIREIEEERKREKTERENTRQKTTSFDECRDRVSEEQGRKQKDAWELFGAVVLVKRHRRANLVGECGLVIRETKENVQMLRKKRSGVLGTDNTKTCWTNALIIVPKKSAEIEITVRVPNLNKGNEMEKKIQIRL